LKILHGNEDFNGCTYVDLQSKTIYFYTCKLSPYLLTRVNCHHIFDVLAILCFSSVCFQ